MKISVYSFDLPAQACAQLRLLMPMSVLRDRVELSWEVKNDGRKYAVTPDSAQDADVIIIQRSFPGEETLPILEEIFASGKPVVYEADDHFLDMPKSHPLRSRTERIQAGILDVVRRADAVSVSTEYLKGVLSEYNNNIAVLPNLLHDGLWRPVPVRDEGPVVIGFAGTPTHMEDLELVEDALVRIKEKHGKNVCFRFFGCETRGLKSIPSAMPVPFEPEYVAYARRLARVGMNIALAPLADNAFNRAKSNIKWLEYSACGAAGVYSDLEAYSGSVRHGETGLLAGSDPDAWFEAVDELVSSPERRTAVARAAQQAALTDYALSTGAEKFHAFWRSASERSFENTDETG